MRVIVNRFPTLGQRTGIGHYTAELLRCLHAQAPGEIASTFQVLEDFLERLAQDGVVSRSRKALDATQQRDAGLRDRVHLPRKQHDLNQRDRRGEEAPPRAWQRRFARA